MAVAVANATAAAKHGCKVLPHRIEDAAEAMGVETRTVVAPSASPAEWHLPDPPCPGARPVRAVLVGTEKAGDGIAATFAASAVPLEVVAAALAAAAVAAAVGAAAVASAVAAAAAAVAGDAVAAAAAASAAVLDHFLLRFA